jgi:hypothetical protein
VIAMLEKDYCIMGLIFEGLFWYFIHIHSIFSPYIVMLTIQHSCNTYLILKDYFVEWTKFLYSKRKH